MGRQNITEYVFDVFGPHSDVVGQKSPKKYNGRYLNQKQVSIWNEIFSHISSTAVSSLHFMLLQ